jgi:hypothetical protein
LVLFEQPDTLRGMGSSPTPGSTASPWLPNWHLKCRLFHGCLRHQAVSILRRGVDPAYGQPDTDFGRGFYTTTLRRQAADWAYVRHAALLPADRALSENEPVVVWFDVSRQSLARLDILCFARGDFHADEYWSFVQHCRSSTRSTPTAAAVVHHHHRDTSPSDSWYDLVCGPVAAFWEQKRAMFDSDQYSFHTARGADVLNQIIRGGVRTFDYDLESA